jgi:cytochrome c peroxidase
MRRNFAIVFVVLAAAAVAGCQPEGLTEAEKATVASLSLSALPPLPSDPSNRYADQPRAAALGATLFFEQRLSRDGTVACSTCHLVDRQFQDDKPRSVGLAMTNRRSMPLADVARAPFLFWDGRRDSLWAQALAPMEDPREHGGTRAFYAHVVKDKLRDRYEHVFGPLPDLSGVPASAGPFGSDAEKAAWAAMSDRQRADVDQVFVNLGKAIAAFERTIVHEPTRFDRFADAIKAGREPEGDAVLTDEEIYGLRLFIGRGNCITCHNGPRFTDDHFHNTGVPPVAGLPDDTGREAGTRQVLADPFNCLGRYSDARPDECRELRFMVKDGPEHIRAFKTPSLRGASDRPPYMHSGQFGSLKEVVAHYVQAPKSAAGHSELTPLKLSDRETAALIAFLKTLSL